ncbi:MAG: bifunctional DNA primase/polymerase, partial [Nitrospirales bacterium]
MMNNSLLSTAVSYTRRGWRLLPLNGKVPVLREWPSLATTDPDEIRKWLTQWPEANIGIATGKQSGLLVLDVDPDKGGNDSLRILEAQYGELPPTIEVKTGGGGRHVYFQHPDREIGNSAGRLGHGLDIRTDGGQVVAPPSIHPVTGCAYEWETAHHPDDVPLAPVPGWILDKLTEKTKRTVSTKCGQTIPEGQRNAALASEAGRLRRIGYNETVIYAALSEINRERCIPPLSDEEVLGIATSVARYPVGKKHETQQAAPWSPAQAPYVTVPTDIGSDKYGGLTKWLADQIQQDSCFAKDAGGLLYVFENGVYRPSGKAFVCRRVKEILIASRVTRTWSSYRASEVYEFIRVDA